MTTGGQGQLAAENNRAIAAKEWEDKRRFQEMKDKADWESRQRQNYNANDGYYWLGPTGLGATIETTSR